jgi:hypothetical protein
LWDIFSASSGTLSKFQFRDNIPIIMERPLVRMMVAHWWSKGRGVDLPETATAKTAESAIS